MKKTIKTSKTTYSTRTTTIKQRQLKNIKNDIENSVKNLKFDEHSDLNLMRNQLKILVENYIKKLDKIEENFIKKNKLQERISNLSADKSFSSQRKLEKLNHPKLTQNFIKILYEGEQLLHKIRELITGQKISTKMYIEIDGEIHRINLEDVPYTVVLSTYGTSESNFYNLAYKVDIRALKKMTSAVKKSKVDERVSDIFYNYLMQELKTNYLKEFFTNTELKETDNSEVTDKTPIVKNQKDSSIKGKNRQKKSYIPRYDFKDSEIYEYMLLRDDYKEYLSDSKQLKHHLHPKQYLRYRNSIGGKMIAKGNLNSKGQAILDTMIKGKATTALQSGDRGLNQVKTIMSSRGQNMVNFARLTQIKNTFKEFKKVLKEPKNFEEPLRKFLLKTFTSDSEVLDIITKRTNEAAINKIEKIFQ